MRHAKVLQQRFSIPNRDAETIILQLEMTVSNPQIF
tara:strand:+ start:232 stop:339 length:108 start_codon:yes stop_codon:yes gene_type:complete